MTQRDLAIAIGLAVVNENFRKRFLENPAGTMGSENLTLDAKELALVQEKGAKYLVEHFAKCLGVAYDGGGGKGR